MHQLAWFFSQNRMRRHMLFVVALDACALTVGLLGSCSRQADRGAPERREVRDSEGKISRIAAEVFRGIALPDVRKQGESLRARIADALKRDDISASEIVAALQREDSDLSPALAAIACMHEGATIEMLNREFSKEFRGTPFMASIVLLHRCSNLEEAVRIGLSLLDYGGSRAMLGHSLLVQATLQPIAPSPSRWPVGAAATINPSDWAFLRKAGVTYKRLFSRSLRNAKKMPEDQWPDEIGWTLRVIMARGNHASPLAIWSIDGAHVEEWVSGIRAEIHLQDVVELVYPWTRLVEAYIISNARPK